MTVASVATVITATLLLMTSGGGSGVKRTGVHNSNWDTDCD